MPFISVVLLVLLWPDLKCYDYQDDMEGIWHLFYKMIQ